MIVIFFILFPTLMANPIRQDSTIQMKKEDKNSTITPDFVIQYMQKFGYLKEYGFHTNDTSSPIISENSIRLGILSLQQFAGLPVTGTLDDATKRLLASSRCGNPDIGPKAHLTENWIEENEKSLSKRSRRYVLGSKGWKKRKVSYYLANWSNKLGNGTMVLKEMKRAFKLWEGYSGLRFVESKTFDDSDITISFGSGYHGDWYPFDGPGNTLAHAYYPYQFDSYGGDIHFDNDENWVIEGLEVTYEERQSSSETGINFFAVAVHEIGHAIGLAHSSMRDSVMYPYYRESVDNSILGYDDILAVYEQYVSKSFEEYDLESTSTSENDSIETTTLKIFDAENTTATEDNDDFYDYFNSDYEYEDKNGSISNDSYHHNKDLNETTTLTYVGDVEEIEDHIRRSKNGKEYNSSIVPDICDKKGHFDAVANLRGEMFIFKGKYIWRYSHRGILAPNFPVDVDQMFSHLPKHIDRIDAAYERPYDNALVFISGTEVWVTLDGVSNDLNGPQNLTDFGLPNDILKLDSAFVWGKNRKTYFFLSNVYWRYDEMLQKMDEGYPKDVGNWRGLNLESVDTVFTSPFDGITYFFQGTKYWRFDDQYVMVDDGYPRDINGFWFSCPNE